jgi:hypothetical protein
LLNGQSEICNRYFRPKPPKSGAVPLACALGRAILITDECFNFLSLLMEQPCYKCGQTVEEGVAFCPHCAAPQIRVVMAELAPTTQGFATATTQDPGALPASQTLPVLALPMRWSQAFRACALAVLVALLLALFSMVVGMLAAGFLAVTFYRQHRPGIALRASEAAKLGAVAGILCSCILSLIAASAATVPDVRTKMQAQFVESIQKASAWLPANPADIQASIDQLKTPQGFATALIELCVATFLLSIVLGGLGGALGSVILGRRDRS